MKIRDINSIAIVGFGRIAEILYSPYLKNIPVKNLFVCENDVNRHPTIKLLLPNAVILDDFNQLCFVSERNAIGFNLVPGFEHENISYKLIEKGWHVFTEKPASKTSSSWKDIVEKARKKKLVIVSAPVTPYLPEVEKLKDSIKNNLFGEISEIHLSFFSGGPARRGYIDNSRKWFFGKNSCVIRDLSPYLISTMLHLFDKPIDFKWQRNEFKQIVKVKPKGTIIPVYGNCAIGIGMVNKALLTISVGYRSRMQEVDSKIQIYGFKKNHIVYLDKQPKNMPHQEIKIQLSIGLILKSIECESFWINHTQNVSNTIELIELADYKYE